ncbi:hypothetical protein EHEL_041340 [Encephalitozoon hellem ATCC 50504]|uniref:YL1 C-terminal domain-containing protein n=1 Tax=Encephalitozoon hellem TaxID=27973 RepID=A0A9Q9FBB9_ENCHE|nr:uncharacterized protein EHEL_041340 [Encephalitozoon hellem ATCC 50504]AFM98184.1 hypothetical protein EHEL_041340 [Encephalitozoon hellem ATCC 50504]UTX43030.1 YL1 C-terminal domain-containing protein [Encephalitozoon hellem]WEL38487.1 YL1 C-terminal domain-containing protein [Encephalitozoon hellem]|eukprot:XP_003887165.1 hypothetical protein EHEL_041340 [Encephalitozoon hellem ATCC 50504]
MKKQKICYKRNSYINRGTKFKTLKQLMPSLVEKDHKYVQISNRVSIRPGIKLCDLTSLPAPYTCPNTRLFYYNSSVYKRICDMPSDRIQKLFQLREFGKTLVPFRK